MKHKVVISLFLLVLVFSFIGLIRRHQSIVKEAELKEAKSKAIDYVIKNYVDRQPSNYIQYRPVSMPRYEWRNIIENETSLFQVKEDVGKVKIEINENILHNKGIHKIETRDPKKYMLDPNKYDLIFECDGTDH